MHMNKYAEVQQTVTGVGEQGVCQQGLLGRSSASQSESDG